MNSVLVGMFDSQADAAQARIELVQAGFAATAVTLTGGTARASSDAPTASTSDDEPHHEGAISRFFAHLFGDDHRDDLDRSGESATYREAFKRGAYGVSVTTADDRETDAAQQILNDCGAVDIDEKAESWRNEGWAGGASTDAPAMDAATTLDTGSPRTLQEIEEQLTVGKRAVARGGVRVFTRVTEVPVTETVRLRQERADIKRTVVDRPATAVDLSAFKEGSFEVREMTEEAVVSKSARVVGEVEIGKTTTERDETIHDTVRRTEVDVEPLETATQAGAASASRAERRGSLNRDPISGAPGAHPVGTGVGAATGGVAAGAAAGSVAGPVGTVVGAALGAVAGGLAGKGVAETIDPTIGKPRP